MKFNKKIAILIVIFILLVVIAHYLHSSKTRIILIGLDGATWDIINPMIKEGKLPNFKKLKEEGSYGVCRSIEQMISPALWTSIATGKIPEKHGIDRFVTEIADKDGSKDLVPITSNFRKVKAIWNILTEENKNSAILNYYVTYPPEEIKGAMVSRLDYCSEWAKYRPANLSYLYYPYFCYPSRFDLLMSELIRNEFINCEKDYAENKEFIDFLILRKITNYFLNEERQWDLFTVYSRSIDEAEHLYWKYTEPYKFIDAKWNLTAENVAKYKDRIKNIYESVDKFLGEISFGIDNNTIVIIVSDHGMRPAVIEESENFIDSAVHDIEGIIILWGKNIKNNYTLNKASILDITPTMIYLLGLPVARDMDGRALIESVTPLYRLMHPVKYIETYEENKNKEPANPISSSFDKEIIERLKNLGYIQ